MSRSISHTEVQALLGCQAKHDFGYVGRLAGTALKSLTVAPRLREGRAWGAAVAAWHERNGDLHPAVLTAEAALRSDVREQVRAGVYMQDEHEEISNLIYGLLAHHHEIADPLSIRRLEGEVGAEILPGCTFEGRVDAEHVDEQDRVWPVEYKLRSRLSSYEQIALSRQIRRYAWAYREATGREPAGVIVEERLREVPKPARILQSGKVSHAKDQLTTPELYERACIETGEEPKPEVVEHLDSRPWWQRVPVLFRPGELDEAGEELASAARQVAMFDAGELFPLRNPSPQNCGGCEFREICPDPTPDLVDALFERRPPKRDRETA